LSGLIATGFVGHREFSESVLLSVMIRPTPLAFRATDPPLTRWPVVAMSDVSFDE
jgi:hypothetical protein